MFITLVKESYFFIINSRKSKITKNIQIRRFKLSYIFLVSFIFLTLAGNSTVYYVSNSGSDSNSGTSSENSWKTLTKVNSFSFKPGDQILFKKGDSWTGTITVKNSGSSSGPIVFGAYGSGTKPKIYGSEIITGWTKHSGNIYKASYNASINQLFINGTEARAARFPNSGYIFITNTGGTTKITADELDPGINYTGAKWFGRTYYYTTDLKDVISSSSKTLTLKEATRKPLTNGLGFFLMNKLEFLDQAGEWYFDEKSKTVYCWTHKGDSPANYEIRASVHENGFYLSNTDYITVQDIEILHQSKNGIYASASDYITLNNVDMLYPDGFGIFMPNNAVHCTITNNSVVGANHYGMMLRTSYSTISDNKISKIALMENIGLTGTGADNYGGGIYLAGENGNNVLKYNRITETGYNGILFANPENIIEYNYVNGACLLKGDMGGIYTSWYNRNTPRGPEGSIVRNNIVLNVVGEKYGYTSLRAFGEGIYIDESSRGVTVENNTIAYCSNAGIYLHQAENATVRNNTILDARQSIHVVKYSGTLKSDIRDNIMVAASDKDDYLKRQVLINLQSGNVNIDNNKYVNQYAAEGIFKAGSPYYSFNEWKSSTGNDKNSVANVTPLKSGEKEQLFYNDTKSDKVINLGTKVYKDIEGRQVTGSFTLKPFTSRILVATSSEATVENRAPVITDQRFEIVAPRSADDFVGKVDASDPDAGQKLFYSIVSGNGSGFFYLDEATGEIHVKSEIPASTSATVELNISVRDNAINPLSANAIISIRITAGEVEPVVDAIAPVITSFSIPSTAGLLNVPVIFSASDNVSVEGWKLSENSTAPMPGDAGWLKSVPVDYLFSEEGTKTLYAWVKDAAGNVSRYASSTVTIKLNTENPDISDSVEYITVCEGQEYFGWTESGKYQRNFNIEEKSREEGVNQIINPEFGETSIGWSSWGDAGYSVELIKNTSVYNSAPASMQVKCTANGTLISKLQLTSKTDVKVEAGKVYELTFHAKGSVPFEIQQLVVMKRTTPYTHYGTFSVSKFAITSTWSQYKVIFNAKETAADGSLRFYLGNSLPVGASLYLDDIKFVEIQETISSSQRAITTYLTVNPLSGTTENVTIDQGENYMGWTETGEYTRVLDSANGCDSVIITNLTVLAPEETVIQNDTEFVSICEGEEYNGWTESGTYQWKTTSGDGAQVMMTTNLNVMATQYVSETVKIWANKEYNGWNKEGYYERVLKSSSGCDSIVITKLIVSGKRFDSRTELRNLTQSAPEPEDEVLDANPAEAYDLNQPGLELKSGNEFIIYPNPAQNFINVEYQSQPEDTRIEIIDGSGRQVVSQEAKSTLNRIEFQYLSPGMYFVRSVNSRNQRIEKLMIE